MIIPPLALLTILGFKAQTDSHGTLNLENADATLFKALNDGRAKLDGVMKASRKRKTKGQKEKGTARDDAKQDEEDVDGDDAADE